MIIDDADPRAVLDAAVACQRDQDRAHVGLLTMVTTWADAHPADPDADPWSDAGPSHWADTDLSLTATGRPDVSESAVAELAAALGLSTAAGQYLVAEALELRHRLPRLWAEVRAGRVRPHRGRQIARATVDLNDAAACFVDDQLWFVAARVGARAVEKLVTEAIDRCMPDRAAERAAAMADRRGVWIHHDLGTPGASGLSEVTARLDVHDGLELEAAVSGGAGHLGRLGCAGSEQVRRSIALGDLARRQPSLDAAFVPASRPTARPEAADPHDWTVPPPPRRPVTLVLHLAATAVAETGCDGTVGRVENLDAPVSEAMIRSWLGDPRIRLTVRPVIDVNERLETSSYAIPERIRRVVTLRDPTCVFPWCDTPSTAPGVDLDHIVAFTDGGPTSTDNLAPLCRTHHRFKTHTRWRYRRAGPNQYVWTSPMGFRYVTSGGRTTSPAGDQASAPSTGPPVPDAA